ncbi:MAG: hypothetical protein U0103_11490 [Candidatus Obscuribacterales bacterium]
MHAKAGGKNSAALIESALAVPAGSSAYLTVRYYAVKLLVESKIMPMPKKRSDEEVLALKRQPTINR